MTEQPSKETARQRARRNHYAEALAVVRGLLAAWRGPTDDPAYQAAVTFCRRSCRSCGEPAVKNSLCQPCWDEFEKQPPPTGRAA